MLPPGTSRLRFAWWRPEDLELARGLWGDPDVTRLIDARGALSEAQVQARLDEELRHAKTHGVQYWPIFERATDAHVGCCGLRPKRSEEGLVFELGFHLRRAFWGRGLSTEAARSAIHFAFDALNATSLFAGHNPKNTASRALLLKLGFAHTHDEHYPPTGLMHPSYSLERGRYSERSED